MFLFNKESVFIATVLSAIVIFFNIFLVEGSSLNNEISLAFELSGNAYLQLPTDDWIKIWLWEQAAPSHYRILGKFIVISFYELMRFAFLDNLIAFYWAFVISCFLCLWFTLVLFYYFTYQVFEENSSFNAQLACVLFVCCPPILFAFKFPIHGSPNDFLGYALILSALISLNLRYFFYFYLSIALGIFCRETNLLVIFIFLFFYIEINILKRIIVSFISFTFFLCYRWFWYREYNPLQGAALNWFSPYESLFFLFLVFASLWLTAILAFLQLHKQPINHPPLKNLVNSFPWITLLTILIIALFARIREIRLEFIIFFVVIPLSIHFLKQIKFTKLFSKIYVLYGLLNFAFIWYLNLMLTATNQVENEYFLELFNHWYGGFGGGWVLITLVYCFIFLLFFPLIVVTYFKNEKWLLFKKQ